MNARRKTICTDDLRKMAKMVSEFGVTFEGRVDPLGGLSFTVAPSEAKGHNPASDDLDDRMARFASQ